MRRYQPKPPFPSSRPRCSAPRIPVCGICDKPVPIETAKTDEDGRAMHEECYLLKIHLEQASSSRLAPA